MANKDVRTTPKPIDEITTAGDLLFIDIYEFMKSRPKAEREAFKKRVKEDYKAERTIKGETREIKTTTPYAIIRSEFVAKYFPDKFKTAKKPVRMADLVDSL